MKKSTSTDAVTADLKLIEPHIEKMLEDMRVSLQAIIADLPGDDDTKNAAPAVIAASGELAARALSVCFGLLEPAGRRLMANAILERARQLNATCEKLEANLTGGKGLLN